MLISLNFTQAIRAPRSLAARATRWTNRLASGNVASRGCDACYWAGTRHDHQMRLPRLWSMSPVTIPSVCRFLSRSRVPSALNSKVNHNNNMNNNCACTVVSRSRGFARFDLTFCHPVNRSSMVNACGLQQCGRRAGAARLDKLPWHHGRPVSHCGTHAGTSVLPARRLRQCQGMG